MILLTAAKMPDGLDKNTLSCAVRMMFSNPENQDYFDEIQGRVNNRTACESLFAIALLYDKITELPCPHVDTSMLVFMRNEMGKPYFKNSDIKFNLSHSKGYVACAVSVGEELGVDIEASEISSEKAEKLSRRYLGEIDRIAVASDPQAFVRKWTENEAKAKFLGESVGNILSNGKKSPHLQDFRDICFHKFRIGKIPITLCTKRHFSSIVFTVQ